MISKSQIKFYFLPVLLFLFGNFFLPVRIIWAQEKPDVISLPGGEKGIGFDDLRYSQTLNQVLVPGGRSGNLDLIDPVSHAVESITGFSEQKDYAGGHSEGITSVDEGSGFLFVTDRSSGKVNLIDPATKKIVANASLASEPDYIRFVSSTSEIWVTEPDNDRIEILAVSKTHPPVALHTAFIEVKGGPEALVIDNQRNRAYTNLWNDKTMAIDLKTRKITDSWTNGCKGRGLVMDQNAKLLFVGCSEGKAVALDLSSGGKLTSTISSGAGIDIIDYNPALRHLYLPGAKSATMDIVAVSQNGQLSLLKTVPTAEGSHCVVFDRHSGVYVCDPRQGRLLVFTDK